MRDEKAVTAALSYRRMANPAYAIDVFLSWGANEKGWSPATLKSYRRLLNKFVDFVPHKSTDEYEREDYERFISLWVGSNPSTRASLISLVNTWMRFLHKRAMAPLYEDFERPRRLPAKDLAVTRITLGDVEKLTAACRDWQERLCIETAVYSGFRRAALANARRGDVELVETRPDGRGGMERGSDDPDVPTRGGQTPPRSAPAISVRGYLTAVDKGGKTQTKPLPREYVNTILEADAAGVWDSPHDYLIPNRRPASCRAVGQRSDKVIWMTVKRVAERAGVRSHVHALRAVFAEACAEMGLDLIEIQDLMGHSRPETTQVYLDRKGRQRRMEKVRDLSFGQPPVHVETEVLQ